jgi:hypothetical protein
MDASEYIIKLVHSITRLKAIFISNLGHAYEVYDDALNWVGSGASITYIDRVTVPISLVGNMIIDCAMTEFKQDFCLTNKGSVFKWTGRPTSPTVTGPISLRTGEKIVSMESGYFSTSPQFST